MPTGTAYLQMPSLRVLYGTSIGVNTLSLPLLVISSGGTLVLGSASLALPLQVIQGTGLHGLIGQAYNPLQIPPITLNGSGLWGPIGETPNSLKIPLLIISGYSAGQVGGALVRLRVLKVTSLGNVGRVGSASLSLLPLNMEGEICVSPSGTSSLLIPLLSIVGGGEGLLDIKTLSTPIRKGIAMNLVNWAVTEYEDYPFNSFAVFNGLQLGGKEDGIFELEGDTDDGDPILAYLETGTEDLFKNFITRLREAWITSRQNGPLVLKISMGERETSPVAELPIESASNKMHEERIKFPRGLKERFASFRLENTDGSDIDLESIRIFKEQVPRRR